MLFFLMPLFSCCPITKIQTFMCVVPKTWRLPFHNVYTPFVTKNVRNYIFIFSFKSPFKISSALLKQNIYLSFKIAESLWIIFSTTKIRIHLFSSSLEPAFHGCMGSFTLIRLTQSKYLIPYKIYILSIHCRIINIWEDHHLKVEIPYSLENSNRRELQFPVGRIPCCIALCIAFYDGKLYRMNKQ